MNLLGSRALFSFVFKSTLFKGLFIKWPDKFLHFTPKHWEQLQNPGSNAKTLGALQNPESPPKPWEQYQNPGSNAKTLRAIRKSKTISSVSLLMIERSIGMGSRDIILKKWFFQLKTQSSIENQS